MTGLSHLFVPVFGVCRSVCVCVFKCVCNLFFLGGLHRVAVAS